MELRQRIKQEIDIAVVIRGLFIALIVFEFLNLVQILNFSLDFSWFGLIITAAAVWLIIESIAHFSKKPKFLESALPISFLGILIDASGDIFHLYSRFGWYDKAVHLIVSGAVAYLIFKISILWTSDVHNIKTSGGIRLKLILSLFVLGLSNLFGILYEIEEYLEDLFIRQARWLRLGDGPDTANDLLFNLLGSLAVALLFINFPKKFLQQSAGLLILLFAFCLFTFGGPVAGRLFSVSVFAAAPEELRKAIEQKSQELQNITNQIKENQQKLETIQEESRTLQRETNKINAQIQQLNLSIRSSEIVIEKLGLEIESLQYNIIETEEKIEAKKKAIAEILRELQQKENESPMIVFLRNKTLSDSVFEIQSLADLNNNLSLDIAEMESLKQKLNNSLDETANKKQLKEYENNYLKNKKLITEEVKKEKQTLLAQTKNKENVYQKILSDLEKKQREIAAEIEKTEEELRLKIDPSALPGKRPGVLAAPLAGPLRLTQEYGATKFASRVYAGRFHNGVDYGAAIGTPVLAAEKGKVIAVDNQDRYCYRGAYGKYVVIQHENNLTTLYAHLSLQTVAVGDYVLRGQIIGYTGKTGYAIGPHLHFTVYASQTFYIKGSRFCGPMPYGGSLNPLDYL